MGNVLDSIDNMIWSSSQYGMMSRLFMDRVGSATTAANTTSGYVTAQRYPTQLTMPSSFGTGVTGAYCTYLGMMQEDATNGLICGIEYNLGSINMSTGAFTSGVSMPSKTLRYNGRNIGVTTGTQMCFAVATASITATTPGIGITYTDQDGNTGQSMSMTLPTSPVINSAFNVMPHLNPSPADSAIRAVTNMTKSAGSAGTLTVYGLLVLGFCPVVAANSISKPDPLTYFSPKWKITASESIAFYRIGGTTTNQMCAAIGLLADN